MNKKMCKEIIADMSYGFRRPESEHWVRWTHVNNPHSFYVFPIKYRPHLELLESMIQSAEAITDLEVLQVIAYKSNLLPVPKIIRGKISSIDRTKPSKTCDIFALDYGFVEKEVPLQYIYECEESISKIPPLALHCKLHMCAPKGGGNSWPSDAADILKYYLGDERAKMIVKYKAYDKFLVEMINTCPDDISTMMALSGSSTFGYVDPLRKRDTLVSSRTKELYYNFKERKINETLQVRMLYGKNLDEFYVSEICEYYDFLNVKKSLDVEASFTKRLTEEEMLIGRPVLLYNPIGYAKRALIKSVSATKTESVTVHLVDNGKKGDVDIKYMLKIPDKCLNPHVLAIYCKTEKLPTGISQPRFFLPGFEFLITIQAAGSELESPYIVKVSLLE